MSLPSFIGIGAQKCASTWIYDVLRDHPEVRLSERKELDFFSYRYERGFQWYERQFGAGQAPPVVGEISPSYFHEPAVPSRIKKFLPHAKIILSLRDPVERALSHHRHAVRVGDVGGEDLRFESALPDNPMYLEQGRYATHLSRWLECFGSDQLLVVYFDDIAANPGAVARRIYRFLDIAGEHRSANLGGSSNVSHVSPHKTLERARKALRHGARDIGLGPLWEWTARRGARRVYRRFNRRPSAETIPPPARGTLDELRVFFRDEMRRLEAMTGRNLAAWRGERGNAP